MALGGRAPGPPEGRGSSAPGPHTRTRLGESRGRALGRASGAASQTAVAATGLPSPPPSPRPGGQGRQQHLMPRRAAAEERPDSGSDPQTPGPARTLKRSSRRHAPLARRPPAPLLGRLLSAHAQGRRPPRLRAQRTCACERAGSAEVQAQAQTGTARRPPPLPHSRRTPRERPQRATCLLAAPPRRPRGSLRGAALTAGAVAVLRHGMVRRSEDASAASARSPGTANNLGCPVTVSLGAFHFFHGPPATRRADPDGSFRKLVGNQACQSGGRLGYCSRHLISGGRGPRTPER